MNSYESLTCNGNTASEKKTYLHGIKRLPQTFPGLRASGEESVMALERIACGGAHDASAVLHWPSCMCNTGRVGDTPLGNEGKRKGLVGS
mmetsp:Transcript_11661/g.23715  ORF Transcript_11661/g.23715 Transcript_11661/m.23715 type:complete len:90 (-) Transcript_11661:953-1222(-)